MLPPAPEPSVPPAAWRPPRRLALDGELLERGFQVVRQVREAAGARAAGKLLVDPEGAEHLDEVRLAAAEEAAHPDGLLLLLAEGAEVAVEDPLQAPGVLLFADEGLELPSERLQLLGGGVVPDLRRRRC
jgi:hypothetical protein